MDTWANASPTLPSPDRLTAGLAVLRIALGLVFLVHGGQKLFVFGPGGVAEAFSGMGVPLAGLTGPAVAFVEFFGGLALILGLLTRVAAVGIAVVMLGAIALVHAAGGFFAPEGVEFVMMNLAAAVTLALTGPGTFSLDHLVRRRRAAAVP